MSGRQGRGMGLEGRGLWMRSEGGLEEGGKLEGLAVRGIRRGAGRMLGMEIQEAAGEEGGNARGWEPTGLGSGRGGA